MAREKYNLEALLPEMCPFDVLLERGTAQREESGWEKSRVVPSFSEMRNEEAASLLSVSLSSLGTCTVLCVCYILEIPPWSYIAKIYSNKP